jgi:hypothetical protein
MEDLATGNDAQLVWSPIELLAKSDYRVLQTNVASYDAARLIILGDLHGEMNEELFMLMPGIVKAGDEVLVEQAADTPIASLDTVLDDLSFEDQLVHIYNSHMLLEKSPENNGWIASTAITDGVCIIPIDAPKHIRNKSLYCIMRSSTLRVTANKLHAGEDIHPFAAWMLYEDLNICNREASASKQINSITSYLDSMPNTQEIESERQHYINDAIVAAVQDSDADARHFVVLGSDHITRIQPSLTERLEEERIGYAVFLPVATTTQPDSTVKPPDMAALINKHFMALGKNYVDARKSDTYAGSLDGFGEYIVSGTSFGKK